MFYRIEMSYMVCALKVNNGVVIDAAPIMKWALGQTFDKVRKWVVSKGGAIQELEIPE